MNDSKPSAQTRIHYLLVIFSIVLTFALAYTLISRYLESNPLPTKPGDLGTFGDYLGGVLNPTIAGLALIWLIYSVSIQTEELRETNKALASTVTTAKQQQHQIAIQNFENLFFQLLSTLNNITNNIKAGSLTTFKNISDYNIKINGESKRLESERDRFLQRFDSNLRVITGKESIKDHIMFYKIYCNYKWEYYYNEAIDDYFGSYFRTCYQITKLISTSLALTIDNDINKPDFKEQKKYFDLFRAQLSSYELEALFFNCLSAHGRKKFKELIENFGLFEHLLLDNTRSLEATHRLTMYAYQYKKSVFENNEKWKNYFLDLKKVSLAKKELKSFIDKSIKLNLLEHSYYISNESPQEMFDSLFKNKKTLLKKRIESNIKKIISLKREINSNISSLNTLKGDNNRFIYSNRKRTIASDYNELKRIKSEFKQNKTKHKLLSDFKQKDELFIIFKYRINFNDFHKFLVKSNNKFPE